jgi:CelD/BcsL family acetyltransferase involved in cellulose biosynthesis
MMPLSPPVACDPWSETPLPPLAAASLQDGSALERLSTEWTQLFRRAGCESPFLTYDWMTSWWAEWAGRRRLFVIAARTAGGELVGLAPLCIEGRAPFRRLAFLGSRWVGADHLDLLVAPGFAAPVASRVARAILERRGAWDFIELRDADPESETLRLLAQALEAAGLRPLVAPAHVCPYTPLPDRFEAYLEALGRNVRANFRRRRRGLDREGSVGWAVLRRGPELADGFATLTRLHRARFEAQGRHSSFLDAAVQRFHRTVLPKLAEAGWARLHLLTVRSTVVAALYGFAMGQRFLFYQSGMDPAWAGSSVGLVMMGMSVEEAIRAGHREFDFLRGDEAYKRQWAQQARQTVTLRLFDGRPGSRCARGVVGALAGARRLRRALGAALRAPDGPGGSDAAPAAARRYGPIRGRA